MDSMTPGTYIVAVSGGVDSMVLLDMLRQKTGVQVVVAHVNHGIRDDAHMDAALVEQCAARYGLPFVQAELALGKSASEATARRARYNFLRQCCKQYNARAIVTAHHADDVIETAILALMRGTGWRGIAPFAIEGEILRPLQSFTKDQLISYARAHHVPWREDSTNADEAYLRNYIRHTFVPTLHQKSTSWHVEFLQHIRKQQEVRREFEKIAKKWLDTHMQRREASYVGQRHDFIILPSGVAYELVQQLFRWATGNSLEQRLAESALLFLKVARPGKAMPLGAHHTVRVTTTQFIVE